jgi:hypothetical protein
MVLYNCYYYSLILWKIVGYGALGGAERRNEEFVGERAGEEQRWGGVDNKVLRRIFGPKGKRIDE